MTADTDTLAMELPVQKSLFSDEELERLDRIWMTYYVNYDEGTRLQKHLERIYRQPRSHRPQCCLIVAEPAAGKTAVALRFVLNANPRKNPDGESRRMPVVYVQAPPKADAAALYVNILRAIKVPYLPTWREARKQDHVLQMLTKLGTRMLIVDELHAMLAGHPHDRIVFMNVLKFLSSELQIPLVGIGTEEVLYAMQTDRQFANRFEVCRLEPWKLDANYVRFVLQICRHAGFEDTAPMRDKTFVRRIHSLSKGLTGETWKLVNRLIEYAEDKNHGKLTMDMLDKIEVSTPGERRWMALRNPEGEKETGNEKASHISQGEATEKDRAEDGETQRKGRLPRERRHHSRIA